MSPPPPISSHLSSQNRWELGRVGGAVLVQTGYIFFVLLNQTYFSGTANLLFGAFSRQGGVSWLLVLSDEPPQNLVA